MTSVVLAFNTTKNVLKRENDGSHKKTSAGRHFTTAEGDNVSPGLARSGSAACRRDSIFKFAAGDFYDDYGGLLRPEVSSTYGDLSQGYGTAERTADVRK